MKKRNIEKRKNEDGWTFIETLIVMGIILILTASVGFTAVKQLDKARIVAAKSQIETFTLALDAYYLDCGTYPSEEQGLDALWNAPTIPPESDNWNGPYLNKAVPKDPWGNDYHYINPGQSGLPYGIISYGKDGLEGGEQNAKDISSWQ